jgi:hypothetical protein
VKTTEELLERKSSGSCLENRDWPPWKFVALTTRHSLSVNLALTSQTSGGRSVGITSWRRMEKWKCSSTNFQPRHWMEVSGQLHATAVLPQEQTLLVAIGQEARWTPEAS